MFIPIEWTEKMADYSFRLAVDRLKEDEMTNPQDPLRKPLLDWYHYYTMPPAARILSKLYKAIEEVYGVDVTKREVPKE